MTRRCRWRGASPASFPPSQALAQGVSTFLARRFIINDTFRSSLCLVHPPHLIAVAAVYLAFALHPPASAAAQILPPPDASSSSAAAKAGGSVSSRTRRQSTDSTAPSSASAVGAASTGGAATGTGPGGHTDPVTFLASLEVDTSLVLEIVQEIVSLYELWAQLEAGASASSSSLSSSPAAAALGVGSRAGTPSGGTNGRAQGPDERVVGILRRMQEQRMRDLRDERTKMAQAAGSAGAARRAG